MCGHTPELYIPSFIEIRSGVSEPLGVEFAHSHYFDFYNSLHYRASRDYFKEFQTRAAATGRPSYFYYFRRGSVIKWNKNYFKENVLVFCFNMEPVWNEISVLAAKTILFHFRRDVRNEIKLF